MPISYQQSSIQAIISTVAPTNPQAATRWLEVDSSNNLIESWFWLNNAWRSEVKTWNINASFKDNNVVFNFYKPLVPEYDYFLKSCLITANNLNGQLTASNYFRILMTLQNNNATASSSPSIDLNAQSSSDYVVKLLNWNYLFISSATNKGLRIIINKSSSLYGDLSIDYFYQAIRK